MRVLVFNVNEQNITKDKNCDFKNIVAGTKNYLVAKFIFDKTWNGYGRVAIFKKLVNEYPAKIDKNGNCIIPSEVLDSSYFSVSVIGKSSNNRVITTNSIKVEQVV